MATWMVALQHGATEADIDVLYKAVADIINQLMGRGALYEWTKMQLVQACLRHQTPIDYETFVRGYVAKGLIKLDLPESKHTAEFLAACDAGAPHPPAAFFKKVGMGCATC